MSRLVAGGTRYMRSINLLVLVGTSVVTMGCGNSESAKRYGSNGPDASSMAGATITSATSSSCQDGTERCNCYGNGTCNAGLVCASNLCVSFGGATSLSTGGAGAGQSATGGSQAAPAGGMAASLPPAATAGSVAVLGGNGGAALPSTGAGGARSVLTSNGGSGGQPSGGASSPSSAGAAGAASTSPASQRCGDSIVSGSEQCDDGNVNSGDGCSTDCRVERPADCSNGGAECQPSTCGNGVLEGREACDLGDQNGLIMDEKSCSRTCTKAPNCRLDGKYGACTTVCGDGNKDSGEDCDDGNTADADGCSSECKLEEGFTCEDSAVNDTVKCSNGPGQCLVLPITFRDFDSLKESKGHPDFFSMGSGGTVCVPNASGRTQGTSGSCPGNDSTALCLGLIKKELDGATGKPVADTGRSGGLTCACQFTDWEKTGVLANATGGTKKTCSSGGSGDITTYSNSRMQMIKSADSFKEWYTDGDKRKTYVDKLEFAQIEGTKQYRFSSSEGRTVYDDIHEIYYAKNGGTPKPASTSLATSLSSGFFPKVMEDNKDAAKICNLWPYWTANSGCKGMQWDARANDGSGSQIYDVIGQMRNFYFTSELRYVFRFSGEEQTVTFFGDDDVWIFINGKLVLDLGATHERMRGIVTFDGAGASATLEVQDFVTGKFTVTGSTQTRDDLALESGKFYELAVFHADRTPRESNYELTLTGFGATRSLCRPR